ncbi:hypothetical protein [Pleionea sp. CnH1-48]|uniref:hypothetical protein n=1 Tax=Pleionea sp. CnH1-48 TaxID=2954494 RepID=UPI002097CDDB|nr:hypothetical protein [Pleionea sp. CnH1-48]MCO7223040.1 hypothetical protein [Pleionea sp. CnH1-48]
MIRILLTALMISLSMSLSASDKVEFLITPPDYGAFKQCVQLVDCSSARSCKIKAKYDKRSCRKCLAKNPFGGCLLRGNDPVCEAAKAAKNAAYQAGLSKKKLECERLKATKLKQCKSKVKSLQKKCEQGKAEQLKEVDKLIAEHKSMQNVFDDIWPNYRISKSIQARIGEFLELPKKIKLSLLDPIYVYEYIPSHNSDELTLMGRLSLAFNESIRGFSYTDGAQIKSKIPQQKADILLLKKVSTIGKSILKREDYQLTINDIATFLVQEALRNGYSDKEYFSLIKASEFDVDLFIDDIVIAACEKMEAEAAAIRCQHKIELIREESKQ